MQEVRDNGNNNKGRRAPQMQTVPGVLPAQVQEAILMLQWFVTEVQSLSPYARTEALRYIQFIREVHGNIDLAF